MAGIPNQAVWVVINSIVIGSPAEVLQDYSDLIGTAPLRGRNRIVPHVAGRSNKARRRDEKPVSLTAQVNGHRDRDGNLNVDPDHAVLEYFDWLENNLGIGEATVPFEWHRYAQSTLGGDVQVEGISPPTFHAPHLASFTIRLLCPPTLEVIP